MINQSFVYQIDRYKKMLVSILKERRRFQAPSFFTQSIEIKNIILVKLEYSVIYTIFKRIIRKIKIFIDNCKKV